MEIADRKPDADRAGILIVDDLPDKLLVLQTILEDLGQELVTARSGEEALRRVLERDFAVILLDINMPGMDGLETAAYIRSRKKSAHTPIIFITAYADEVHTARGYSLGAVDYIFSPVVPEVLRSKVRVFVDLHLMTQQVRRQADEQVALAHEQAARAAAETATRRFAFLAEASTVLSSTLDFGTTLRGLARLVVPDLADLGMVSRMDETGRLGAAELTWIGTDGTLRQVAVADTPPALVEVTRRCLDAGRVIQLCDIGPWPALPSVAEPSRNGAVTAGCVAAALRSVVAVPLVARGRTLGVLTLAFGPSGRSHNAADLALASDLVARAATAMDNARLYQNIQQDDERKNQFLAMLAHELRNPLAPIRNAVEVLKLIGGQDATLVQARDMIDRQAADMARLVDDLLDLSRLARGKILLRKERLDLTRLVRDAAADYRSLLAESGVGLETHLPMHPMYVEADATRLSQVLGNVLHNAGKFTEAGGTVTVTLAGVNGAGTTGGHAELEPEDATGSAAESAQPAARLSPAAALLSVRDNGIGMERKMLDRVFETFSQADASLDRSRGGLGLGLALVRGLAELHGGTVHAHSDGLGMGTEITICLPLATSPPAVERHAAPAGVGTSAHRVLIIEDNPDAAESMRLLFSLTGHMVEVAHGGAAGLTTAHTFRPQVILCDIGLPGGMDGFAVARAIRSDASLAAVRLIAISGYGQEADRRRSQEAGFDTHLTKPVDFADLQRLLTDHTCPHPAVPIS